MSDVTEISEQTRFVALIMGSMAAQSASTADMLIESYREDAADRTAELAIIRERLALMFAGPYTPSEAAIFRALRPTREDINEYRRDRDEAQ